MGKMTITEARARAQRMSDEADDDFKVMMARIQDQARTAVEGDEAGTPTKFPREGRGRG